MPLCGHRVSHRKPTVLRAFFLFIFPTATICAPSLRDSSDIFIIDDASGSSDFYTSPVIGTDIPADSNNSNTSRWTTQVCSTCPEPRPALENVKNATYTAVYIPAGDPYSYTVSFKFNSTGIDIYFILSNQAPTSCEFLLDGNSTHSTMNTTDVFQYQKLAFSSPLLQMGMHDLTIKAVGSPDTPNYLNFDYAQLRPSNPLATRTTADLLDTPSGSAILNSSPLESSPTSPPSPSASANPHNTAKAIAGGVVGGFIAIIALILAASFYRNKRLKELEETAHPFTVPSRSSPGSTSPSSDDERRRLMSLSISTASSGHRHSRQHSRKLSAQHSSTTITGVTPFTLQSSVIAPESSTRNPPLSTTHFEFSNPHTNRDSHYQERVREERRRELNQRLDTVETQRRALKSSLVQDQQRLQNQQQRRAQQQQQRPQQVGNEFNTALNSSGDHNQYPPVIRLIPGGLPDPLPSNHPGVVPSIPDFNVRQSSSEGTTVTPAMLADMQQQIHILTDHIQNLHVQQNSPYAQGLTDERPPGYVDVVNPYDGRRDR
ncbi:hypothetical protein NP233_g2648 [Leucocoprinus birnbaumii]|uniref:Uncharacterized protein n=1 Tax=Leucocoprinus birnbaumii TaxID=56174 RepID=A0AAD5VY13_9AGAR|nr:hypothetical protein NP233_g2648 [Leucocoprinus birnbaumii]